MSQARSLEDCAGAEDTQAIHRNHAVYTSLLQTFHSEVEERYILKIPTFSYVVSEMYNMLIKQTTDAKVRPQIK